MIFGSTACENPTKLAQDLGHIDARTCDFEHILRVGQAKIPHCTLREYNPDSALSRLNFTHAAEPSKATLVRYAVTLAFRPVTAFLVLVPPEIALKMEGPTTAILRLGEPNHEQGSLLFDTDGSGDDRDHWILLSVWPTPPPLTIPTVVKPGVDPVRFCFICSIFHSHLTPATRGQLTFNIISVARNGRGATQQWIVTRIPVRPGSSSGSCRTCLRMSRHTPLPWPLRPFLRRPITRPICNRTLFSRICAARNARRIVDSHIGYVIWAARIVYQDRRAACHNIVRVARCPALPASSQVSGVLMVRRGPWLCAGVRGCCRHYCRQRYRPHDLIGIDTTALG